MIDFNKWYRFKTEDHQDLFLSYAISIKANLDIKHDYLSCDCLRISRGKDGKYYLNYRTTYDPYYMDAEWFTDKDASDIEFHLNKSKGDNKMVECYKEMATVRSIMEREYNREMRELEDKRNKLIDEAYLMTEIGKQAEILADLIMANTCLKIDFKQYLSNDIMPLSIQREIEQIKENFSKEANKLAIKYQNLEAMLSICETYEQKEKLLKKNHII